MNGSVAEFVRWDAGCWSYGSSVINSYHQADDYGQPYPCPNGLGLNEHTTANCPAWRRRVDKARSDADEWSAEIRVRELAEQITIDELQHDIGEIRTWANSLSKLPV